MELLQQGDVLIEMCGCLPEGAKIKNASSRGFVLAEGEVTGHAHCVENIAGVEFYEKDGMFYLVNDKPVKVKHEEHGGFTIPIGIWKIRKVREYDHFDEEAREVLD